MPCSACRLQGSQTSGGIGAGRRAPGMVLDGRHPTGTLIVWDDPPYGSGDTMPTGAVHGSAPLANGRVLVGPLHSAGIGLGPRAVADAGGSVGTNGPGGSPHSVGRLSERPGMLCGSASATGATADSACCLAKAFASSLARA